MTPNFITKRNLISRISSAVDKYKIKDGIMYLIPIRFDFLFLNSAGALISMFHMMTALVISTAIIDFATERGQSPNK